jgi:hypothetical protein
MWLRSYAWLRLYARLQSKDITPVVCPTLVIYPDSACTSRIRSMSWLQSYLLTLIMHHGSGRWACRMSYHLSYERLRMAGRWLQHLIARTLYRKQTRRDAWLIQHSKPRHLMASHVQESGQVSHDQQTLSPAWSERNPTIQKDSVPLVTWADQGLRLSG